MPTVNGPPKWILAAVLGIILISTAFLGYAWTREPPVAAAQDVTTNGAPRVHALRVRWAPGGEVYASLRLENRSRLPVEIVDLVAENPDAPEGYYAAALRVPPDEGPVPRTDEPLQPFTLDGGASIRVVVVYRAAPCEALAEQPTPNTFSQFVSNTLRVRILGLLPKTLELTPGRMFVVPVPSRADCSAGGQA
jgi:hypothetical protein